VRVDTTYRSYPTPELDSIGNQICEEEINRITKLYVLELSESLESGKTYKITAEAPGYETVTATQELLPPPDILNVTYDPMSRPGLEGDLMDALNVTVQDIPNQDNYFEFNVFVKDKEQNNSFSCWDNEWSGRWTESFTPGVEAGNYGISLIKDDLFDAGTYNVELLTWHRDTAYYDMKVEVKMISRDKYLFSKSIQAYEYALGNPFAEPVIVHTNVENGQGVFSMENSTEVIIE